MKAQKILEEKYGVGCDVWSVTSYKELYRDANDCERWNMLHPGRAAESSVRHPNAERCARTVRRSLRLHEGVAGEHLGKWVPGQLVSLGTDGFGRSENRAALRDFFEVDAKHIVLATLGALAREKKIGTDVVKRAVRIWESIRKSESGDQLTSS